MADSVIQAGPRRLVTFAAGGVQPPSGLYIGPDERLAVQSYNSVTAQELVIRLRFLRPDGEIIPQEFSHVPATNRTLTTTFHGMSEGWLLSLRIVAMGTSTRRGQTWARANIHLGDDTSGLSMVSLVEGYVAFTQGLYWPGGRISMQAEGPGVIRSILGTNPAAGAETSETVPTNARWRLLTWQAQLVTDGTGVARTVTLIVDDGTTMLFQSEAPETQAISTTRNYVAARGLTQLAAVTNTIRHALPNDLELGPGYRLRTSTATLAAGDNWGPPQLLVEELIEAQ